jgi:putative tricarboxylic transport membrane protein
MNGLSRSKFAACAIAIILAALAVFMLVTAYAYSRSSGLFPIFVGWIFVALALLESGVQLKALLRREDHAPALNADAETAAELTGPFREIGGLLWLGLYLAMLYLAGFLVATPLFMIAFLRLSAARTILQSVSFAIAAAAIVYVVFVLLLDYQLYRGILFGG